MEGGLTRRRAIHKNKLYTEKKRNTLQGKNLHIEEAFNRKKLYARGLVTGKRELHIRRSSIYRGVMNEKELRMERIMYGRELRMVEPRASI